MIMRALIIALTAALMAAPTGAVMGADVSSMAKPAETPELVEKGREIYIKRCSFCHGLLGDGEGPAAKYLDPRPRDFTLGTFKFRTTQSGELPTDADLFRTVSRGLSGTAMQAFDSDRIKNGLDEADRWAVIAYIKTFAQEFQDPELDPAKTGKVVKLPATRAAFDADAVAKGKAVFERAKCWECHGKLGRGDGQKSFDRKDDWGFPIRIRNVTHPWKIKAGDRVEDIYMRFSTGISGSPMPSFVKALKAEDRWYLANFIKSLQIKLSTHQVLKPLLVEGAVPDGPEDAKWAGAEAMDVRLAGQVVVAPRWQNPSIDLVTIKSIRNTVEIAFLLEWDDPFKDETHLKAKELNAKDISKPGAFNSYVEAIDMVPRKLKTFRDSVALQFPIKSLEGTKKPYFLRGGSSDPVHLLVWKADSATTEESIARGWTQNPRPQPKAGQQSKSKSVWRQGRWSVVIKRPLLTEDRNDVQFRPGKFIPMAVNAWDGSNGEHGLMMSLSTWYFVFLEAPVPMTVYIWVLLAVIIIGGLGFWLMRKAEKGEMGGPRNLEENER